jgi:hypothetical protein
MQVSNTMLIRKFSDKKMDTDDPEHISWLYKVAAARAQEFNIEGVTWSLTQGVVKNIIPSIASTNAIIAGSFPFLSNGSVGQTEDPQPHVATRHSRLPRAPLHISTTTSCLSALTVSIHTHGLTRNDPIALCVVEKHMT